MTNAIFTLLYHPSYLPGALVLGTVLKKLLDVDPSVQATTGVLIDKSQFNAYQLLLLSRYYSELIDVKPNKSNLKDKLHNDLGRPELDKTYTKVELWNLLQYDRVLYLDCDTLPTIPTDPSSGQGSILNLLKLDFPTGKILAAPDSGYPDIFNSGVFALKPDSTDYNNLVAASRLPNASFDGADQGLLNQYFNNENDWVKAAIDLLNVSTSATHSSTSQLANWIRIPFLYNVTPSTQYEYLPAYKYFTGDDEFGGANVPLQPTKDKVITPRFKKPSKGNLAESVAETKGNYAKTAFEFINVTDKVKLIHFIGPYKPWKVNCSTEGLYQDWWNIWFDEFGHRSFVDVINEVAAEAAASEGAEIDESTSEAGPVQAEVRDVRIDPYDVLNPDNYQHIPDLPKSRDAAWDATKEAPPGAVTITCDKSAPTPVSESHVHTTTDLAEIKAFVNVWDEPEDVALHRDESKENSNATAAIAAETSGSGSWWSHADSKPAERVFYNEFDYNPSHILRPLTKVEVEPIVPEVVPKGPAKLNDEAMELAEQLGKTGLFEDNSGFDEIYHENQTPTAGDLEENAVEESDVSSIPKIFPWEHRKYKPLRTFD